MKKHDINNEVKAEVFSYLEEGKNRSNKEKLIGSIVEKINYQEEIGYAGYDSKEKLKYFLSGFIKNNKEIESDNIDENVCFEKIEESLKLCKEAIKENVLKIFLFPTFDEFVSEKMKGFNGYCPNKNVILLFFSPSKEWKGAIKGTVAHELTHSLSPYYSNLTVGNGLVFEGIAECFKENFVNPERNNWTKAISKKEAKSIFNEIRDKLDSKDWDFYEKVFFGTGKFPTWAGYTIGYYLIKKYLKKIGKIDWDKIINTNPKEILANSGFGD